MLQPPKGLFTPDGDAAPEYWVDDLFHLRKFIEEFYAEYGMQFDIPYINLLPVVSHMEKVLCTNLRIKTPSVFKRAAAFCVGFMQASPLKALFGPDHFGEKIGHIENHQNAILAFEYARMCLHGASYTCGGEDVTLSEKINVSHHFYSDLIQSFTTFPTQNMASAATFHTLALLLESLAYRRNDGCSDPAIV